MYFCHFTLKYMTWIKQLLMKPYTRTVRMCMFVKGCECDGSIRTVRWIDGLMAHFMFEFLSSIIALIGSASNQRLATSQPSITTQPHASSESRCRFNIPTVVCATHVPSYWATHQRFISTDIEGSSPLSNGIQTCEVHL